MRSKTLYRRHTAYCLALAFVGTVCLVQSQFVLSPLLHLDSDMKGYVERALALVQGHPVVAFDRFYPPGTSLGYAFIMLLFGPRQISLHVISVLQSLCLVWAAVMAGRTARILWRSPRLEIVTIIALGTLWPLAALGSFFLSEPLYCALYFSGQQLAVGTLLRPRRDERQLVLAGVCFGLSALVRTQGLFGVVGCLFWLLYFAPSTKRICSLLLGVTLPLLALIGFNIIRGGTLSPQIAANDAFNVYLGQSRRAAVACLNPEDGTFYVFHNNNASEFSNYLPLELLPCSMTDREFFFQKIIDLWRGSPSRQLLVSVRNLSELFTVRPGWPLVAYERGFEAVDRIFQRLGILVFVIPALLVLLGVVRPRIHMARPGGLALLGVPFGLFLTSIAIATGQPRYLLPSYYTFVPLACPLWFELCRNRAFPKLSVRAATISTFSFLAVLAVVRAADLRLEFEGDSRLPEQEYELAAIRPPLSPKQKFWWSEISKEGLATYVTPKDGLEITTEGFGTATPFGLRTDTPAKIRLSLKRDVLTLPSKNPWPQNSWIALYLRDEPKGWGSVAVRMPDGKFVLISDIRGGRWFSMPISTPPLANSALADSFPVEIQIQKFTGDSMYLDAAVLYQTQ